MTWKDILKSKEKEIKEIDAAQDKKIKERQKSRKPKPKTLDPDDRVVGDLGGITMPRGFDPKRDG